MPVLKLAVREGPCDLVTVIWKHVLGWAAGLQGGGAGGDQGGQISGKASATRSCAG